MAKSINEEIVEKVKVSSDIVNIVSDYVQLRKSGTNHIGLCPFHNEKTPSFTVSETKQIFHCFGCGEGGDAVSFIMKKENLDFPGAVIFLADKLGIEILDSSNANPRIVDEKNKTYEINKEAARYFYNNLVESNIAQSYLKKRMLSNKVIRQFGLGYSLDSWDSLYKYLSNKRFSDEDILRTGLIGKKKDGEGYFDKLRNRIIFPIIDTKSRVIGFGGRVLDNSLPKYLNSPDTNVFNKGNHLYGLNLLNKYSNRKRIILVEGYMDVISLFNNEINYSVASLGTALTDRQAKLIKRYGEEVYICYDSDAAGIKAALRAIDIILKVDINPRIIVIPGGQDPDEFILKNGLIEFERLLVNSYSHVDFKVYTSKSRFNLDNLDEKIEFTREVARIIRELKSPIEQDVYIDKISKETGITKDAIEREVKGNKGYINKIKNVNNINNLNKIVRKDIKPVNTKLPSGQLKAEIELIKLMIKEKDYFEQISKELDIDSFDSIECKNIYNLLNLFYKEDELIDDRVLFEKILEIPNLDRNRIDYIFLKDNEYQPTNINRVIDELIKTVLDSDINNRKKALLIKIEELDKKTRNNSEDEELRKLMWDLIAINKELNPNN